MQAPSWVTEIFLGTSELYWGDAETRIRTVLGSCVAICVWHPELCIGGMTHSLLPTRPTNARYDKKNAHYVDEAVNLLAVEAEKAGTNASEYRVTIFGGGNILNHQTSVYVGRRNIEIARLSLKSFGFKVGREHVEGHTARVVLFDLWSGDTWLKQVSPIATKKGANV